MKEMCELFLLPNLFFIFQQAPRQIGDAQGLSQRHQGMRLGLWIILWGVQGTRKVQPVCSCLLRLTPTAVRATGRPRGSRGQHRSLSSRRSTTEGECCKNTNVRWVLGGNSSMIRVSMQVFEGWLVQIFWDGQALIEESDGVAGCRW